MSILRGLSRREGRAVTYSDLWNAGADMGSGSLSLSGTQVSEASVLGLDTAWACGVLLCDAVSMLPVDEFDANGDEVEPSKLITNPSNVGSGRDWRWQAMFSMVFYGNAYGARLTADSVELLPASQVSVLDSVMEPPAYWYGSRRLVDPMHLRRFPKPGSVKGMAPLETQRETYGVAIAARNFASEWFGDGAHPSALLTTDQQIDGDVAAAAKSRFVNSVKGRQPVTLGNGWKYEPLQLSPQDSELTELKKNADLAVCRAFRVAPEMVGLSVSGSSVTYANREQRSIDFLTYTLQPWLSLFEDWWSSQVPGYVRFNTGALLRTDLKTRYEAHALAIGAGWKSPNEVRQLEDMAPVAGADELREFDATVEQGDDV